MTWTRRSFLNTTSAALAGAALPGRRAHAARTYQTFTDQSPTRSPELKALILRALDAARGAGATYADVQVRVMRSERLIGFDKESSSPYPWEFFYGGIGVRALINGYWGFSGRTGTPTADLMTTLGRDAAAQARIASSGPPRSAILAPTPVVREGHWETPIEIDPFTGVSMAEKFDFAETLMETLNAQRYTNRFILSLNFTKEERTFASSDGSYLSQIFFTTGTRSYGRQFTGIGIENSVITEQPGGWGMDCLTPAGAGWEYVRNAPFQELLPAAVEQAHYWQLMKGKPVEPDRYDIVCDAKTTAKILDATIGAATELDRAMGYEANGVGTSFLSDPLGMLGNYKMGSSLVTVTADRSMRRGAATARWDDEGAPTKSTTLVKDGILTDFQTTREAASWLAPYYQQRNMAIESNGCAGTDHVTECITQTSPNFTLTPGAQTASFEDLVRNTKNGVAVINAEVEVDHQALNGSLNGGIIEIKDGKLTVGLQRAVCLFRAPEFWRNVTALGGTESVLALGIERSRARRLPQWPSVHTVSAVPVAVTGVAVVDGYRRA